VLCLPLAMSGRHAREAVPGISRASEQDAAWILTEESSFLD
jgi:hypothetical protein